MKTEQENAAVEYSAGQETILKGIAAASGIEIGIVLVVGNTPEQPLSFYETAPISISEQDVPFEISRLDAALDATRNEITEIRNKVQVSLNEKEAGIFDAHLLIVEDRKLKNEVV